MVSLVESRLLPEGDPRTQLQTLQREVSNQLQWIRRHEDKHLPVDKETYKRFLGILISALYVYSPQGRCQGIEDLKYGQADELLNSGYIQTTKFKTQAKWGYQPVTLSIESKELLQIYLRSYRPIASGSMESQQNDAMLLSFSGQPLTDIGKEVTAFYLHSSNLHITTTRIRSIVETAAEEMYRAGEISLKTRKSIEAINGHTSATVQNYYLQMDRAADVHSARSFFSQAAEPASSIPSEPNGQQEVPYPYDLRVHHEQTTLGIPLQPIPVGGSPPANEEWLPRECAKHLDWGCSHPEYGRVGVKKVKWSSQELAYITEWIENDTQGDTNLPVSRCLTSIRSDPRAVPIFHAHHILNSPRLRNGFESAMKKKAQQMLSDDMNDD